LKTGVGTSCPISAIALTVAMKASRPSAINEGNEAPDVDGLNRSMGRYR
jgi:hypothetical protein